MIQLPCMQIMMLLNSSREVVSLMMLFFAVDSGETRNIFQVTPIFHSRFQPAA